MNELAGRTVEEMSADVAEYMQRLRAGIAAEEEKFVVARERLFARRPQDEYEDRSIRIEAGRLYDHMMLSTRDMRRELEHMGRMVVDAQGLTWLLPPIAYLTTKATRNP